MWVWNLVSHSIGVICIEGISELSTVELSYNDLSLWDTSFKTLYILWYQLILHMAHIFLP